MTTKQPILILSGSCLNNDSQQQDESGFCPDWLFAARQLKALVTSTDQHNLIPKDLESVPLKNALKQSIESSCPVVVWGTSAALIFVEKATPTQSSTSVVVIPATENLEVCKELKNVSEKLRAVKAVIVQTPVHFLIFTEALGLTPDQVNLIPPAVDDSFFALQEKISIDSSSILYASSVPPQQSFAQMIESKLSRKLLVLDLKKLSPTKRRDAYGKCCVAIVDEPEKSSFEMVNVVLEAMSCGLPIVGTASFANQMMIQSEREGFLIPPANIPAILKTLNLLLSTPKLYSSIQLQAREKILQTATLGHFSMRLSHLLLNPKPLSGPQFFLIPAHEQLMEVEEIS